MEENSSARARGRRPAVDPMTEEGEQSLADNEDAEPADAASLAAGTALVDTVSASRDLTGPPQMRATDTGERLAVDSSVRRRWASLESGVLATGEAAAAAVVPVVAGDGSGPTIVKLLPDPVCPYAMTVLHKESGAMCACIRLRVAICKMTTRLLL
jgi:hypothetical protein